MPETGGPGILPVTFFRKPVMIVRAEWGRLAAGRMPAPPVVRAFCP
jgi:hypothetical protein